MKYLRKISVSIVMMFAVIIFAACAGAVSNNDLPKKDSSEFPPLEEPKYTIVDEYKDKFFEVLNGKWVTRNPNGVRAFEEAQIGRGLYRVCHVNECGIIIRKNEVVRFTNYDNEEILTNNVRGRIYYIKGEPKNAKEDEWNLERGADDNEWFLYVKNKSGDGWLEYSFKKYGKYSLRVSVFYATEDKKRDYYSGQRWSVLLDKNKE